MSDEKVWTVDDTRQMLKEQRAAQVPVVEPAKDAPPVMTVDDVKRMLKGLPPLTDKERAEAQLEVLDNARALRESMAARGVQTDSVATLQEVRGELEAETGHDVVQTGNDPPTLTGQAYVETDKPVSAGVPKGKPK